MSVQQQESNENIPQNYLLCSWCHLFYKSSSFELHLQNYPSQCLCSLEFSNECEYQQHFRKPLDSENFHCCSCWDIFKREVDVKKHLFAEHRRHCQTYTCQDCDENFFCFEKLASHDLMNRDEKEHVCSICSAVFRRSCFLKKHQKESHMQASAPQTVECKNSNPYVPHHLQSAHPSGIAPRGISSQYIAYVRRQLKLFEFSNQAQAASHPVESPIHHPEFLPPTGLTNRQAKYIQTIPQLQDIPQMSPARQPQVHVANQPVEPQFNTPTFGHESRYTLFHHPRHFIVPPPPINHPRPGTILFPPRNHPIRQGTVQSFQDPYNPSPRLPVQNYRLQPVYEVRPLPPRDRNDPQAQHPPDVIPSNINYPFRM